MEKKLRGSIKSNTGGGVSVDENHSWAAWHKKLKIKLKRGLSSIRKLKNILPQTRLDQVYRALLESHVRYCNEIWGAVYQIREF